MLHVCAPFTFGGGSQDGTPESKSSITDARIAAAIDQLGDQDFAVRVGATQTLWAAGPAAEGALKRAVGEGGDPEVVRRARAILSNIAYGITPDMSDEVIALMSRYRAGDAAAKQQAASALTEHGGAGARVLLKLLAEERDAAMRPVISALIVRDARELAVSLIGDGDAPAAGRLLKAAAAESDDESAPMNYAAFLLVHGGLDEAITETRAKLERAVAAAEANAIGDEEHHAGPAAGLPEIAMRLTFLHRANGDLAGARAAAERSGDDDLLRNILIEQGDWQELARRVDAAAGQAGEPEDVQHLCFAAAFHRLAGDEAAVDRVAQRLAAAAAAGAECDSKDVCNAAEGLLLNGRVDLGAGVLVKHLHLPVAIEFNAQRLAFADIPRLVERARARGGEDQGTVEVKAARALWYTTDPKAAKAALDAAVELCERRRDLPGLIAAVGAAHDMGLAEDARWHTVAAMTVAARVPQALDPSGSEITPLFEQARFENPARAAGWWQVLRQRFPREPAGKTLETLRAIDRRRMKGEDVAALCNASWVDALARVAEQRDAELELIADTLAAFDRRPTAVSRYTDLIRLAEQSSPGRVISALTKLAAMDAADKNWRAAADRYFQAWTRDRANPVPLYLSGWSLSQAGDASTGKQRIDRARLIPLCDQNLRFDLFEALSERKLTEEAKQERALILRTAEFLSWRRSEALRRAGDEAHAAGDFLAAADLWERAFLDNNSELARFVEPSANVSMPALVRRARALGLIKAGKVADAVREADACLAMSPGDADALIEIVTAFDAAGHKAEADILYKRVAGAYAKLCDAYPGGGPLHNLYAWSAAKCRRELDAALAHAKRAVTLQPTNTASLDTLAETHFQRGELTEAIVVMSRCVELEPDEPRHKEQVERFRKAAGARR